MTSNNIDYINRHFQFPELSKIHGEPTYEALQIIKDELKANATSVQSSLGGGANGHLGLILTPVEYARISNTGYTAPPFPTLVIPPNATGPIISQANREFIENMRVYRETLDVGKALIRQIVAAIDSKYLKTLRNDNTNTITRPIPDVLTYLFNRYGKVTPDRLSQKELEVRSHVYNLQEPLVSLFDQVEDLKKLGDAAQMPYTELQITNFGVQLIRNTHDFLDGLKNWYDLPQDQKSWANFKLHFEEEYDKLKLIRGESMEHAGFHQANFIASQLKDEVQSVQHNVLQLLKKHEDDKENTPPPPPVKETANATIPTDPALAMQMEMLKLIKSLQQEVSELKNTPKDFRNNPHSSNYRGRMNRNKYCWSHGGCNHKGRDCKSKREGHKDEATFFNRMGGSNSYCREINS
jgi:hypothetical protein